MSSKKGLPTWKSEPSTERQVRIRETPESADRQTIAWHFYRRDREHHLWGWSKLGPAEFVQLLDDHLQSLESMTWAAIQSASGGRRRGNNNHFVRVEDMLKAAKDRLIELRIDDVDELFSVRLTSTLRLYGIRDGRVLRLVWHDPHHGTADGAYPVQR